MEITYTVNGATKTAITPKQLVPLTVTILLSLQANPIIIKGF